MATPKKSNRKPRPKKRVGPIPQDQQPDPAHGFAEPRPPREEVKEV